MKPFLLLLLFILTGTPPAGAETIYYLVTTDINGPQTDIDNLHTSDWHFTPAAPWLLGGADLFMKDGPATTGSTYLSLSTSDRLVAQVPLTHTQFCADHGGKCNKFAGVHYLFPSPLLLSAGTTYTLTLTGPDIAGEASRQYFIKGAHTAGFYTDPGQTPLPSIHLSASLIYGDLPTPAPEPASWTLALALCLLAPLSRRP